MHIIQVMKEANRKEAIYFLLTAYLEAVWHEPAPHLVPDAALQLPLRGSADVEARWALLCRRTGTNGSSVPPDQRDKLNEALSVFRCAVERLQLLDDDSVMQMPARELYAA